MSKIANVADALFAATTLAATSERAAIVKWLLERAALVRNYTARDADATLTREQFANSIEGYAAAIERGSHRGQQ